MADPLTTLWPEVTLFITVCIVMIMGLSKDSTTRRSTIWVSGVGLLFAFAFSFDTPLIEESLLPSLPRFVKPIVLLMGLLLLPAMGSIDHGLEREFDAGRPFVPLLTSRGEFLSYFLLSIVGVLLCTTATDLIWLFLALELTSLPTYVMVASSRGRMIAHEAAVKYFFLGAVAAAVFLYGFALLYGATGSLRLVEIREALTAQIAAEGGINRLAVIGVVMSIVGIAFKIAAAPMHFYVADVYEGAATPVSAFLAFVPKTAGFVAIMLIGAAILGMGESGAAAWPRGVHATLWIVAALTMTVGNTLALMQRNVKRILAYSSVAHSGYMLLGVIAGPSPSGAVSTDGYAAVIFYLFAYGVMNVGAFLVIASLQRRGEELETLDDLAGLARTSPGMATVMAICSLSLLGLPPLIGFFGKIYLFAAGVAAGEYALVIVAALNSAVAAWYYLKLAGLPWLATMPATAAPIEKSPFAGRRVAAFASASGVIVLVLIASPLMSAGHRAVRLQDDSRIGVQRSDDQHESQQKLDQSPTPKQVHASAEAPAAPSR